MLLPIFGDRELLAVADDLPSEAALPPQAPPAPKLDWSNILVTGSSTLARDHLSLPFRGAWTHIASPSRGPACRASSDITGRTVHDPNASALGPAAAAATRAEGRPQQSAWRRAMVACALAA